MPGCGCAKVLSEELATFFIVRILQIDHNLLAILNLKYAHKLWAILFFLFLGGIIGH